MRMRARRADAYRIQQRMSRSYFGPGPIWQAVSSSPAQGKGAACGAWLTTAALAAAFVCGCATESAPQPPAVTPAAFEHRAAAAGAAWPAQDWYHGFGSDELNALVDEAVRDNKDLTGARERVA
jgi:hypothetical protein